MPTHFDSSVSPLECSENVGGRRGSGKKAVRRAGGSALTRYIAIRARPHRRRHPVNRSRRLEKRVPARVALSHGEETDISVAERAARAVFTLPRWTTMTFICIPCGRHRPDAIAGNCNESRYRTGRPRPHNDVRESIGSISNLG